MDQEILLYSAWKIVDRLEESGEEAYLVGGYVRDKLLGRPVKDIDIATSAHPETVMRIFERAEPTGLQHGTVTVVEGGRPFEVTTFRSETGYSDYRRPDQVRFIRSLHEDLSRRDFTMNAMALSRQSKLIDPFGGKADLEAGVLRAVGDPMRRFMEDALRMLRCIRFAAEYRLAIDGATWDALRANAPLLANIAAERIRAELERMVEGSYPLRGLSLLADSGIVKFFPIPLGIDVSMLVAEEKQNALRLWGRITDPEARWAYLYAVMETEADKLPAVLRKLTFAKRKANRIHQLLRLHERVVSEELATRMNRSDDWKMMSLTYGVDTACQWVSMARQTCLLPEAQLADMEKWIAEMPVRALADLAVDGTILQQAGISSGPRLGRLLRHLFTQVALGKLDNTEEALLREALNDRQAKGEEP